MSSMGIIADSRQQFLPSSVAGLRVWLKSSDVSTVVQTANAVEQWSDKSGNGFHVTQSDPAKKPTINTSSIGGKNVITFDGLTQFLSTPTAIQLVNPTTGEWSFFGVLKSQATTGFHHAVDQDSAATSRAATFIRAQGVQMQSICFDTTPAQYVDQPASGWVVGTAFYISAVRTATNIEIWKNGASNGAGAASGTPATLAYNLGIGCHRAGHTTQSYWWGDMAEVMVYNVAVAPADRVSLENYLKAEWGF